MAVSDSPNRSSKGIGSPQIESLKQKKSKKLKRKTPSESEPVPDSTQHEQEEAPPVPPTPSSSRKQRTKSPGIRVVGGRIYDSENGKTCHQCRQKTMDFVAACKGERNNKPCTIKFCHKCLLNRYGEKAEEMDQIADWKCPKCRGICNCSFCMKKRGHQPTGILFHTAKATGFKSVSEMLTVNGPTTKATTVSSPEDLASNKENTSNGINGSILPSNEKKIKKHKKKKVEHNHTDGHVVEESKEGDSQSRKKAKKAHVITETNSYATPNEELVVTDRVDGAEKKQKAKKKAKITSIISETNLNATPNEEVVVTDSVNGGEKKLKKKKRAKKTSVISETNLNATPNEEVVVTDIVNGGEKKPKKKKRAKKTSAISETNLNATPNEEVVVTDGVDDPEKKLKPKKKRRNKLALSKGSVEVQEGSKENEVQLDKNTAKACHEEGKEKTNETGGADKVKVKKSKSRKKTISDSTNTQASESENPEDKPEMMKDCKPKTEPDVPLPLGITLTTVADIELPAVDVGPALQFLEFCNAFEEILQLKEGEPESVLRELASGCSRRRRQYSAVVRFHVQLLDLIEQDIAEECPSSPKSNGNSWFEKLGKCISESHCTLKDMPLKCFDRGSGGYESLDLSEKLRLLNFLCEEALGTTGLRAWIEKQNEEFKKSGKEAKEKVFAAKDRERSLKQQMRDEVAKAILSRTGVPLSVSEHENLIAQIKLEAANAQAEKLDALGMVPKKEERSDAVRTEPVLMDENGLLFWKLQSCSAEPNILLQDVGNRGSDNLEKWFTYDVEQKEAVDNYFSCQRRKRLRLQVLPHACRKKKSKHTNISSPASPMKEE